MVSGESPERKKKTRNGNEKERCAKLCRCHHVINGANEPRDGIANRERPNRTTKKKETAVVEERRCEEENKKKRGRKRS